MDNEVLAVIPARGGSKGIPRKNLVNLCGKPLLAYSIEAALSAACITRVIVSTEDEEIAQVARSLGVEIPFLRPPELAGDSIHSVYVVLDALTRLQMLENYIPSIAVMLLPTSPLRSSRHIEQAVALFQTRGAPAVISVYLWEKQIPHLRNLRGGMLEPLFPLDTPNVNRQDLESLYVLNGAINVASPSTLLEHKTFHVKGAIPFLMGVDESIDINSEKDLKLAENLLQHR